MTSRFEGQVAVVTGAASGIGAATARRLHAEGAAVLGVDVDDRGLQRLAGELGGLTTYVCADVGVAADWAGIRRAAAALGPVSVLHSNAAAQIPGALHQISLTDWDRQIAVNLTAIYHGVRSFLDDLRAVVVTSSVHAHLGFPGNPGYAATKGAMCSLVAQLAVEYGPRLRINAVLPGPIHTPAWRASERELADTAAMTALHRLGESAEVAAAVAFLASADASYITGATLVVDGGFSVRKTGPADRTPAADGGRLTDFAAGGRSTHRPS